MSKIRVVLSIFCLLLVAALSYQIVMQGIKEAKAVPGAVNFGGGPNITPAFTRSGTITKFYDTVGFIGGNVGIGTTAPGAALHVVGDAYFTGDVAVASMSAIPATYNNTNILPNPSFEVATATNYDGWVSSVSNGAVTRTTTDNHDGAYGMSLNVTVGGSVGYAYIVSTRQPVSPSSNYTISTWAKVDTACGDGFYLRAYWMDRWGNYTGSVSDPYGNSGAVTTSWALYNGNVTSPATAYSVKIYIYNNLPNNACNLFIDQVSFRSMIDGDLLVNGNVGIGTTAPGGALDVASATTTNGYWLDGKAALTGETADNWLRLNQSSSWTSGIYTPSVLRVDGELRQGSADAGAYELQTSGDLYVALTSTLMGNVGIGTTAPGAKLDINSTQTSGTLEDIAAPSAVTLAGTLIGTNINLSTNYTATNFGVTGQNISLPSVTNTGAGTYTYNGLAVVGGSQFSTTAGSGGTSTWNGINITMPTTNSWGAESSAQITGIKITGSTTATNTPYALTTDSNAGYVGIGTTSPLYKLTVEAGTGVGIVGHSTSNYGVYGISDSLSGGVYGEGNASNGYGVVGNGYYGVYGGGTYGIYSGSGMNYFSGNVGIGTGTPGYPLDVTGAIRGSAEIISSAVGAYGNFRAIQGNYGTFIRNDGTTTYWLLTASGNQYGTWNTLRPFAIDNASGNVTLGHVLTVNTMSVTAQTGTTCWKTTNQLGVCTSSRTVKHDIQSLSEGKLNDMYNEILDMDLRSFVYNGDKTNKVHYGLIAEEAPSALQIQDTINGKSLTNLDFYSQWAYSFAGIKVLNEKVTVQQKQIDKLEQTANTQQTQIDELKKTVQSLQEKLGK